MIVHEYPFFKISYYFPSKPRFCQLGVNAILQLYLCLRTCLTFLKILNLWRWTISSSIIFVPFSDWSLASAYKTDVLAQGADIKRVRLGLEQLLIPGNLKTILKFFPSKEKTVAIFFSPYREFKKNWVPGVLLKNCSEIGATLGQAGTTVNRILVAFRLQPPLPRVGGSAHRRRAGPTLPRDGARGRQVLRSPSRRSLASGPERCRWSGVKGWAFFFVPKNATNKKKSTTIQTQPSLCSSV